MMKWKNIQIRYQRCTIILTDITGQRAMGQGAGQIIGSLSITTSQHRAHQGCHTDRCHIALEGIVHNRLDMINDLSDKIFGYWDKVREIANVKEHPEGEVEHDENGNVIYATDKNVKPIKDSYEKPIILYKLIQLIHGAKNETNLKIIKCDNSIEYSWVPV
ncbi:hypothetical protein [Bartonella sp. AC67GZZY]|uniref:hypothetical protein n=1 Tax=Bartonella sp. AC67GZZY TaxID=3243459 RepID=UPI0035D12C41